MIDILLGSDGDISVTEDGDISLTDSIRQAVRIRLRWIFSEWRLGDEFGFPWFEEVFVKNPNLTKIKTTIRETVLEVEGITAVKIDKADFNVAERTASFAFTAYVNEESFSEEVKIRV